MLEGISDSIVDAMDFLPDWLMVMLLSMFPFWELRGTILLWGADIFPTLSKYEVYLWAVLGNLIPVPLILKFFPWVEQKLRRFPTFERFFNWLFERTRRKAEGQVGRYKEAALIIFVAIPLPITGAWTGSLIAYLFDLGHAASFLFITVGVLIAGVIMLTIVLVSIFWGIVMICGLIAAAFVLAKL